MFGKILLAQLRHKWRINALVFLTLSAVITLYVYIFNTNSYSNRSMQLIMKNMGLNQLIIPAEQDALDTYLCTGRQMEFPETTTTLLARHADLLSRYYLSVLQQRTQIDGQTLFITGIRPVARADETSEKGNPVPPVANGTARLGAAAAEILAVGTGGLFTLDDRSFKVSAVLPPQGTPDDYRIYLNLEDAQELLDKPGLINAIHSFECLHVGDTLEEIHRYQRELLARVAPDLKQINIANIARGRYLARTTTSKYLFYLLLMVAALSALVVIITGCQEVLERRYETGILLARGAGYPFLIGLYLTKTLLLATAATLVGFIAGGQLSVAVTAPFLVTHTQALALPWQALPRIWVWVCAVALLAELVPIMQLVRMDPCAILVEE
ncbi:MAG: FtsX-like permease family protein [Kiritimatiellia bacterium]|nr:hypothetical protein [Lentisphaerota bacterium]